LSDHDEPPDAQVGAGEPTPVAFSGADGDFIYLHVKSTSGAVNEDGSEKWYDVSVDKRDGIITCNCPDAEYRAKFGLVSDPLRGHTCIHIRRAMDEVEEVLKSQD
jgi:hypothetical protein